MAEYPVDFLAHSLSVEETLKAWNTSSQGLSRKEAQKRLALYGPNVIEEEELSKWKVFFRQCHSIVIYVLLVASLISVSIGRLHDFFIIIFLILINSLVGFWQEIKAHTSIKSLKKLTESKEMVLREGELVNISSRELVPGDYISLSEGDLVCADIRLCESSSLFVDEMSLTGESIPVEKDALCSLEEDSLPYEWKNMLLAGTVVLRGSGRGVVVRTGITTYFATIAEKVKESSPETPVTRAVRFFLQRYTLFLIFLFFLIGVYAFFQGRSWIDVSYILVAELVSCIPEGFPIVMTLVMVVGAIALSKKKTYVRYLPSVETLGSTTVIASDKTGTITEGKLCVKDFYAKDKKLLKIASALCNDADGEKASLDPIDLALAQWVEEKKEIRTAHPRFWEYPFDTKKRIMATAHHFNGSKKLFIKGAYEALFPFSENKEDLPDFQRALERFSNEGQRVIAFGVGEWKEKDPLSSKIQMIGIVGFQDPPKVGVKEAIAQAKRAKIRILMLTGDHRLTAEAIASEVGIEERGMLKVLEGKEIEEKEDEVLLEELKSVSVIARSMPEHKYRIVKLLQKMGEVVAVSGDGVNDVPALKVADLGIAMGSGTEAAKNAAKMVIADNNLQIIVEAIRNGRVIADNIRKVIYYFLASGLQEICLISFSILGGLPLPLSAVQILWVNLISAGAQDKFFAFTKEEGNVMERTPRNPIRQFFDRSQIFRVSFFGLVTGGASFLLFRYLLSHFSYSKASTIIFTSIVFSQWINGFQAQKEREPFLKNLRRSFTINPWIYGGVAIGIFLQLFAVYGAPSWFYTSPMALQEWLFPLGFALFSFFVVEVRKWFENAFRAQNM